MTRTRALVLTTLVVACGCQSKGSADAGDVVQPYEDDDASVAYEGDTTGGVIPELPTPRPMIDPVDAGTFSIDRRCCNLNFTIEAQDVNEVSGAVIGSFGPLAVDGGLTLHRSDAGWSAPACFPLEASAQYAYHFWQSVVSDGGANDDGGSDGGLWVETVRFNADEPNFPDGLGGSVNFIPSVADCQALDASVGVLP